MQKIVCPSPIFLENIKDIDQVLFKETGSDYTLCKGFNNFDHVDPNTKTSFTLFDSIHKTNKESVITLLMEKAPLQATETKLLAIHQELLISILPQVICNVIFEDCKVQLMGKVIDSISSHSYSLTFDKIFSTCNPQDEDTSPP